MYGNVYRHPPAVRAPRNWHPQFLPRTFVLVAETGVYNLAGPDTNTEWGHRLDAALGTYAVTGIDVNLRLGFLIDAATGVYNLVGPATNLLWNHNLIAALGTYTLVGIDVNLNKGHSLTAELGIYVVNSPGHLSLPGTTDNNASSPDAAPLDITGDIDLRAEVALDDWTPSTANMLSTKWQNIGQKSFRWWVDLTGAINFQWSTDGTLSEFVTSDPAVVGFADGTRHWVRVTLDVDAGASDRDITFYTSDDGVNWTQLGDVVNQPGVTNIFSGTDGLLIGADGVGIAFFIGKFYRAQILNGIDGTIEFDANFGEQVEGITSFTEDSANAATVTINQSGSPEAEIFGDISLRRGFFIDAATGVYVLAGPVTNLLYSRVLVAALGTYSLVGLDTNTEWGHLLTAVLGTYNVTGIDVNLRRGFFVSANTGVYVVAGTVTNLIRTHILLAALGTYVVAGPATNLEWGHLLVASLGTYLLVGTATILTRTVNLVAALGTYSLVGPATNLNVGHTLVASLGTYALTGINVILTASGAFIEDAGQLAPLERLEIDSLTISNSGDDATIEIGF